MGSFSKALPLPHTTHHTTKALIFVHPPLPGTIASHQSGSTCPSPHLIQNTINKAHTVSHKIHSTSTSPDALHSGMQLREEQCTCSGGECDEWLNQQPPSSFGANAVH